MDHIGFLILSRVIWTWFYPGLFEPVVFLVNFKRVLITHAFSRQFVFVESVLQRKYIVKMAAKAFIFVLIYWGVIASQGKKLKRFRTTFIFSLNYQISKNVTDKSHICFSDVKNIQSFWGSNLSKKIYSWKSTLINMWYEKYILVWEIHEK